MTVNLQTTYLGLELANPLVVAACPLTEDLDMLQRLEQAGAAAAVFPSLFEEQIEQEQVDVFGLYENAADSFAEATSYFPELEGYNVGPEGYLDRLAEAKRRVSIPIIGSLNGVSTGGWVRYATLIQEAGADALELNIYHVAADPERSAGDVEKAHLDLVQQVREAVSIPLAVKLAPQFTSLAYFARQLVERGVNGLTLFTRLVYPDIDLEQLAVHPYFDFSTPAERRPPLMWMALLRGRINASLAATGGVHSADDALRVLLAGADVIMLASALYQNGPGHLANMLDDLHRWMDDRDYESVAQLRGSLSLEHSPDPSAYERVSYMRKIASFSRAFGIPQ